MLLKSDDMELSSLYYDENEYINALEVPLIIVWTSFCSRYVDLLLGEFKHYKTRLDHGGISKEVSLSQLTEFFSSSLVSFDFVCYYGC